MALVLNVSLDEPVYVQAIDGAHMGPVFKTGPIKFVVIGKNGRHFRVAIHAPENVVIDLTPPDGLQVGPQKRK